MRTHATKIYKRYRESEKGKAKILAYRTSNKERMVAYAHDYNRRPEVIERKTKYNKTYNKNNREKDAARARMRMKLDMNYKLSKYLRARTRLAVKRGFRGGSAVRDLGCYH